MAVLFWCWFSVFCNVRDAYYGVSENGTVSVLVSAGGQLSVPNSEKGGIKKWLLEESQRVLVTDICLGAFCVPCQVRLNKNMALRTLKSGHWSLVSMNSPNTLKHLQLNPWMAFTLKQDFIWCEMWSWTLGITFCLSMSIIWDIWSQFPWLLTMPQICYNWYNWTLRWSLHLSKA